MLADDLADSRARTTRVASVMQEGRLLGPKLPIVNPPLWELGHVGWFQERWCLRHRADGSLDPSLLPDADALYDSSAVAHPTRWALPLPSRARTLQYLADVLDAVLERLRRQPDDDSLQYFVRLATFHEDMHAEAFHYTCQTHGYEDPLGGNVPEFASSGDLPFAGGQYEIGARPGEQPPMALVRVGP